MGLGEWAARRGNIGGTARFLADQYHKFVNDQESQNKSLPNWNDISERKFLFVPIIIGRYTSGIFGSQGMVYFKKVSEKIQNQQVETLSDLAWEFLTMETNTDVPPKTILSWKKIIREELLVNGVDRRLI